MSRLTLVAPLALAVLAVAWGFGRLAPSGPDPAPRPSGESRTRAPRSPSARERAEPRPSAVAPSQHPTPAHGPLRDLFAYADTAAPPAPAPALALGTAAPTPPVTQAAPEPTPTPHPVRLVGFVRRADGLRAVLRVRADVVLAATGERAGEFVVLALDEDAGVRLRGPDGSELTLPPAR